MNPIKQLFNKFMNWLDGYYSKDEREEINKLKEENRINKSN